jgi:hypothetical protein
VLCAAEPSRYDTNATTADPTGEPSPPVTDHRTPVAVGTATGYDWWVSVVRYVTHPDVRIDPSVPVPDWGLSVATAA